MDRVEEAVNCMKSGFLCSQAVLSTYSEQLGLDNLTAKKISCAFGAGLSRLGLTCGAVSGACMVIGLKYGKTIASDNDSKEKTYLLTQKFVAEFTKRNGTINCKDLLGYDLGNPEEYSEARDKGLFVNFCTKLVRDASEILEELIAE
jgi:C_GCAxxG_C_C family probable redox protein